MLSVFSPKEYNRIIILLVNKCLTHKQKLILKYISLNDKKYNVTKLVSNISKNLNCSKSNIWDNIRILKNICLISCGSLKNKGILVQLTKYGKLILKELEKNQLILKSR